MIVPYRFPSITGLGESFFLVSFFSSKVMVSSSSPFRKFPNPVRQPTVPGQGVHLLVRNPEPIFFSQHHPPPVAGFFSPPLLSLKATAYFFHFPFFFFLFSLVFVKQFLVFLPYSLRVTNLVLFQPKPRPWSLPFKDSSSFHGED